MKIAFVGKGGSGKTTISALVARLLASQGFPVLAIDADINQHLGQSLGMSSEEAAAIPPMGADVVRIKDFLRGTNPRIANAASMIKTTPPGEGSQLVRLRGSNPLFEYFSREICGVRTLAVGPFGEEDVGVKCYHSKTGSVELVLNHLVDAEREYVIVDMTAGADSFASGLFTRFDVTFVVVEPTAKSVSVYEQYRHYADRWGVDVRAVGNKVVTADDRAYLQAKVQNLVACMHDSSFVRRTDREEVVSLMELERENVAAIEAITQSVDVKKKNWKKYYDQAVEFHTQNALSWANSALGVDVRSQIDPTFRLEEAV